MDFGKRLTLLLFAVITPLLTFAQDQRGLDERINDWFDPYATGWESLVFTSVPIGNGLSVPIVLIVLVGGATFFTIYFSFVNIRKFGLAVKVVRGHYDELEGAKPVTTDTVFHTDEGDIP
ncbi:MAG: hypothetical protein R3330_05905, partial [Saprospiraceae bacterium]|nr:hypothetical protein [Saprospiraceae bacterium]